MSILNIQWKNPFKKEKNLIMPIEEGKRTKGPAKKINLARVTLHRIQIDAQKRRDAITEMEQEFYPFRYLFQQMCLNTKENGHIKACVERRKDLTLLRTWEFKTPSGEIDKKVTQIFCEEINGKLQNKTWFNNWLSFALDSIFHGYTLIYMGDVVNNDFPDMQVVKRWHVSPDRLEVTSFPHMTEGDKFLEEPYADSYVWISTPNDIGTSPCGYGLYFELSMYEILARNLLGFNGDYVEVNIAPFRQIKTTKQDEERDEIELAAQEMGTSGYIVTDLMDEVIFHASSGGTGYLAYDNFEVRLHAAISKLILGHADAMSSIPGKLGNDNAESPAAMALKAKETTDAKFILPLVNKILFDKLRSYGFVIPEGTVAAMLNDNEEMDTANMYADLGVKMSQAGLQMTPEFFTEKTGIPTAVIEKPEIGTDNKLISKDIKNLMDELYG